MRDSHWLPGAQSPGLQVYGKERLARTRTAAYISEQPALLKFSLHPDDVTEINFLFPRTSCIIYPRCQKAISSANFTQKAMHAINLYNTTTTHFPFPA
jgi:hypothetical protein